MLWSESVLNVSVRSRDVALPHEQRRCRPMRVGQLLSPRLRLTDPGSVLVGHLVSGFIWSPRSESPQIRRKCDRGSGTQGAAEKKGFFFSFNNNHLQVLIRHFWCHLVVFMRPKWQIPPDRSCVWLYLYMDDVTVHGWAYLLSVSCFLWRTVNWIGGRTQWLGAAAAAARCCSCSETIHAQRWKNKYANKNKQMLPKHVSAGWFTLSGEAEFSCTATHIWEIIQKTSSFLIFICKMSHSYV